jgi:hypothetical protein
MWGYAALGAATWFAAVAVRGSRVERAASWLMIANGVMSVVGAVVTAIKLDWVLTPAGFANYVAWNALVLTLSVLLVVAFRRRAAEIR